MRLYQCGNCGNPVFFENTKCVKCGYSLGYWPQSDCFISYREMADLKKNTVTKNRVSPCKNRAHKVCNWLTEAGDEGGFCEACKLNQTIPNLERPKNMKRWRRIEAAKHRLIYSLNKLDLPLSHRSEMGDSALKFDFLAPQKVNGKLMPVMTGHLNGLITLSLQEASPVHREAMKAKMKERYRTLLGHFRHETGHFYWEVLVKPNQGNLNDFNHLFGNADQDYGAALQRHYNNGAPKDWQSRFITKYASSHPWEDWAETWAHYLHIIDTLETAYYFGIQVNPKIDGAGHMCMAITFDPYTALNFDRIIEQYIPLIYGLNALNRSIGKPDLYPFILSPQSIEKLRFVHRVVHER